MHARLEEDFAGYPIAVCWFVNFTCNAHCPFCCKSREVEKGNVEFPILGPARAKDLLTRMRRSVDMLYISGGEPLIHPHINTILRLAKELEFSVVGMASNLINLNRKRAVLGLLDVLSASIHSPDIEHHARCLGVSETVAKRIFRNLAILEDYANSTDLKVIINYVITEDNTDGVLRMVDFTRERGFLLEVVPANEKGHIPAGLKDNGNYVSAINELIKLRKEGKAKHLAGSTKYFEYIRDFREFRCFPYGVPNVLPDGRLCTPCDVSEQYYVNVLDHENLDDAVEASLGHLGAYPCREGKCFKAGILERSRLFGILCS